MYTYDGDGKRVKKSTGALYWYGGGSDTLLETDLSGSLQNEYIFFGGRRVAPRDASGSVFHYFADHLGSSRVITNATGTVCYEADFYPYGGERAVTTTCSQNYKFTGKERDAETGNDNFGARYYPNNLGRFLTPDPLMASGRASNPQSWNRYAYTLNNPVRFIDPNGLQEQPCATTDQECAKRRQAANGKGKVTVTAGITTLEPVTSDKEQAKQKELDKVAMAAEREALALTRAALKAGHSVEYGGWIIQSNKDGSITYTKPAKGGESKIDFSEIPVPKGFTIVAEYHTHPHNTSAEGEGPSPGDINNLRAVAQTERVDRTGYVADTFSGAVYRYTQWEPIKSMYDTAVYGTKIGTIPPD
jgi:RHS repeat-associated protein